MTQPTARPMREFIGTPTCRLKRVSKSKRPAVYFCLQCHHTTGKNECPFARARLEKR